MNAVKSLALGVFFLVPAISACSKTEAVRAPEGGHLITCDKGMKGCVGKAEKLCGDKGYTVVGGSSRTHLLGGESSSYRQVTEEGSLEIRCGIVSVEEQNVCHELPARTDTIQAAPVAVDSSVGMRVCVPGATQRCVGVGACDGGQVCLADGQGFGACDCGGAAAPAVGRPLSPAPTTPPLADPAVPGAMPAPTPLAQ